MSKIMNCGLLVSLLILPAISWPSVQDDRVSNLFYANLGVKQVYENKNNVAKTILHHIRSFASADAKKVGKDYTRDSTFMFGPGGDTTGGTFKFRGRANIVAAFGAIFEQVFLPETALTFTSASRIGNQFYQTFDYQFDVNTHCVGSDTFSVDGHKIQSQTAFIFCD